MASQPMPEQKAQVQGTPPDNGCDSQDQRHIKQMRMLATVRDAVSGVEAAVRRLSDLVEEFDRRAFYRAAALAGYNANPDARVSAANPTEKARWAAEDAEALLAYGGEEMVEV